MKKLLIATDFSANAKHAAEYGYFLAKQLKAGVFLCNAFIVPAETPMAGLVVWPQDERDTLLKDSIVELQRLKAHLEQTDHTETFRPPVDYLNEAGMVKQFINEASAKQKVDLVIAATHQQDGLSSLLLGNHTRELIDNCNKPLLIIPNTAQLKPVEKIAFAVDLEKPENDLQQIYQLIEFARLLDAEVLLTHIYTDDNHSQTFERYMEHFLIEIANKANYPKIYYRTLKNDHTEAGLNWLCEHGQIDILAMVHRKHGFFDNLLHGSHTQKMAKKINIPLMVLNEN
jgi:nucleotide-binding universal stress UspA family protein